LFSNETGSVALRRDLSDLGSGNAMPLVSVVIPTFSRPQLVSRAVSSVLAQTVRDLEVIVVIDGTDPATVAALDEVADRRLHYIVQSKGGAGKARDTGADASKGEWVAFLDDDDEWEPEKLERQLRCAQGSTRLSVVMSLSRVVSSYGTFIKPETVYDNQRPIDEWLFDRTTWTAGRGGFLQTSSLMMPRALFNVLHFTDTKQHEEWELVIRAVKQHGFVLLTDTQPSVIYYLPEKRQSLSRKYTWKHSLDWALGLMPLLTPRAFSGFCLTVTAELASSTGQRSAFLPLFRAAFIHGKPTAKQIAAFAYYWACPETLRRRLRATVRGSHHRQASP
jgi:glycosyltransferase involved in cell wall biosynthesis